MLKKITDFTRGLIFGLMIGGSAGLLIAPAPGEETQSTLAARLEAARAAFEQGRAQTEKELLEYFRQARGGSSGPER